MKKILCIALAVLMTMSLFAGCGAAGSSNELGLVNDGKLTVAISPDFAPMEFVIYTEDGTTQYAGFDVMLAEYLADGLGLELQIMPMDFGACQTAVQMGTVDMSISGFSKTAERAENYNLSDFYYAGDNETQQVTITLAENEGKYDTAESVAGLKVGAQTASLQYNLCVNQLPDTEIVIFTDLTTGLLQLQNGDFDVMAVADGNADAMIANNPGIIKSGFQFVVTSDEENNVILLNKNATELTAKVNELLAKAYESGFYGQWYAKAEELAGIGVEVSFDEQGNPITG
jgi:polar amino acid transport system substrate-binding protein